MYSAPLLPGHIAYNIKRLIKLEMYCPMGVMIRIPEAFQIFVTQINPKAHLNRYLFVHGLLTLAPSYMCTMDKQ